MKSALKTDLKSNFISTSKSYTRLRDKEINLIDLKFYQKIFVVFISMSTFLIFPESPRESENICESYNSKKMCNIW